MALISGIVAAVGTFLAELTWAAVGKFVLKMAIGVGLSVAAQHLQAGGRPDRKHVGVRGTIGTGGTEPRAFMLGRSGTAGSLIYHGTWSRSTGGGKPNNWYVRVVALSDLPVAGLVRLAVNGTWVTINSGNSHSEMPSDHDAIDEYDVAVENVPGTHEHLYIKFYDGTQTSADPYLIDKFGDDPDYPWTSDNVGNGVAYAILTSVGNRELFPGFPDYFFELDGIALYDIRKDTTAGGDGSHRWDDTSTWEISHNPMVMSYNILRGIQYDGEWLYGLQGMVAARLPYAAWKAAMDYCDAEVENSDESTEPRFRAGGEVSVDVEPVEAIRALVTACEARMAETGGIYKPQVGPPTTSVIDFTDSDIIVTEEQDFDPLKPLSDMITGISGRYPNPAETYESHVAPERFDDDLIAIAGGRRLPVTVDYDLVPYKFQVQRLNKLQLLEYGRQRRHSFVFPPWARVLEPGDHVRWTSSRNGYDTKWFRVEGVTPLEDNNIGVQIVEMEPDDYDYDAGVDELPDPDGVLVIRRPQAQVVQGWDASPWTVEGDDGRDRPGIRLVWDASEENVQGIRFQVRRVASGAIVLSGNLEDATEGELVVHQGLVADTDYEVRGRFLADGGRHPTEWSDWIEVTTPDVRLGADERDTTPLDAPSGLTVDVVGFKTVALSWTNPTDSASNSLSHVELFYHTSDDFSSATAGGSFTGESGVVSGLETDETYWFWAVAVNWADAASEESSAVSDTTRQLVTTELEDELVTAEKIEDAAVETAKLADLTVNVDKIANDAVEAAKIASGAVEEDALDALAVSAAKVQSSAVTTDKIADDAVESGKLASEAVGEGHLQALAVTEGKVAASAITTAKLADLSVEAGKLASEAVTAAKLAPLAVEAAKLADNAVTETKVSDDAITTPKLAANSVVADKLAANTVSIKNLVVGSFDNLILNPFFSNGELTPHVVDTDGGALWGIQSTSSARAGGHWLRFVADGQSSIASVNLNGTSLEDFAPAAEGDQFFNRVFVRGLNAGPWNRVRVRLIWRDETGAQPNGAAQSTHQVASNNWEEVSVVGTAPEGTALVEMRIDVRDDGNNGSSGDNDIAFDDFYCRRMVEGSIVVDGTITATHLAADSVTAGKIESGAVTTAKLDAGAVTAVKIDTDAVTADKILAGAVDTDKLAANAVEAGNIAADAVEAGSIASGAVTTDKLDALAVTTAKLDADAVTADKILAGSITTPKLAADAVEADKIAAGAIETEKLAAGSVVASKIQTGAIATRHLVVGSFDNLVQNPGGEAGTLEPHAVTDSGGEFTAQQSGNARSGGWIFHYDPTGQSGNAFLRLNGHYSETTAHAACGEGDRFRCTAWSRRAGSGTGDNRVRLHIYFADSGGSLVSVTSGSTLTPSGSYQQFEVEGDAPSGAAYAAFVIEVLDDGEDRQIRIDDIYARRMVEGSIVVDGTITGTKIAAETVVAGNIAAGAIETDKLASGSVIADTIASGAVTTAKLDADAVTADKILAGSITTPKLAADAVEADKIAAGTITTGHIDTDTMEIGGGLIVGEITGTSGLMEINISGSGAPYILMSDS